MSPGSVILLVLALTLSACGPSADDAERDFQLHSEAFEQARRLAVDAGAASGEFSTWITRDAPGYGSDQSEEIAGLLAQTEVKSVHAVRDSVHGWQISFLIDEAGITPSGRRLTVEHAAVSPRTYGEFHELRDLGNGWYLSDYMW